MDGTLKIYLYFILVITVISQYRNSIVQEYKQHYNKIQTVIMISKLRKNGYFLLLVVIPC